MTTSQHKYMKEETTDAKLLNELLHILQKYCGEYGPSDGEGAAETLTRKLNELRILEKKTLAREYRYEL